VSMGTDVFLVGPVPTPAVAHLTKSMGAAAGIMLTASHNPHDDNGIKIFGGDGYKLSDELEEQIEELVLKGTVGSNHVTSAKLGKAYRIEDARGRYIEFAKSMIGNKSLKGLKIVLDCANGAAYFLGPLIFKELGAEVIKTGVEPDGLNINNECGAIYPDRIKKLVLEHGADAGIALDGDADRVIFCDERGNVGDGDRILAICAVDLKACGALAKDTLVVTSMSNMGLHEAMRQSGINIETTDVGDRNVIERMRQGQFNLGGEKSGHIIFSDYATTGDGILSALKVLSIMQSSKRPLSCLSDCLTEYPQRLESFATSAKPPLENLPRLSRVIKEAEAGMGVSGRVIVRYSGTENKMRVLVECSDRSEVDKWTRAIVAMAREEIGL